MNTLSYASFQDRDNTGIYHCSRCSDEETLLVNCSGSFSTYSAKGRPDYYLMYMISGNLTVDLPDREAILGAGDYIIFPPQTRYRYIHWNSEQMSYMWVHFTGSGVEEALRRYKLSVYPDINEAKESGSALQRFQSIFDAFSRQDEFRDRELALLLERLLISLGRRKSEIADKSNALRRSLTHIHSGYSSPLRIPELAALENLSVSRYNTLFKKIMDKTPTEYITALRISSATELLVGTDLPIASISSMVGYRDPHFFSRIFKSHTGKSPTEYRNAGH